MTDRFLNFTEPQWRRNYLLATLVDVGIDMQKLHGTQMAAKYMYIMNIDLHLAMRVLTSRNHRSPDRFPSRAYI